MYMILSQFSSVAQSYSIHIQLLELEKGMANHFSILALRTP